VRVRQIEIFTGDADRPYQQLGRIQSYCLELHRHLRLT